MTVFLKFKKHTSHLAKLFAVEQSLLVEGIHYHWRDLDLVSLSEGL
jgi:hypothetical protein